MQIQKLHCAPFTECQTEINKNPAEKTEYISIAIPMYNLIEDSDNYSDAPGSLWQFKRDKLNVNDINTVLTNEKASSFKYKASIIGNEVPNGANSKKEVVKIAVPLKYLNNFWRSLEMSLVNCKVELRLNCYAECMLIIGSGTAGTSTITDTKFYDSIVTLKTEENVKLSKLLNEGF